MAFGQHSAKPRAAKGLPPQRGGPKVAPELPDNGTGLRCCSLLTCLWSLLPLQLHHFCLLLGPCSRVPWEVTLTWGAHFTFLRPNPHLLALPGDPRPCELVSQASPVLSCSANHKNSPPWAQLSHHPQVAPFLLVLQRVKPSKGPHTHCGTGIFFCSKIQTIKNIMSEGCRSQCKRCSISTCKCSQARSTSSALPTTILHLCIYHSN